MKRIENGVKCWTLPNLAIIPKAPLAKPFRNNEAPHVKRNLDIKMAKLIWVQPITGPP